jgi:hypothetical protein
MESPNIPCGKYIWLEDPEIMDKLKADEVDRYNVLVENTRVRLLRDKYGPQYVQYCVNPHCVHASRPFMDKIIMDALSGKLTSSVHINKRCCPACATSWCDECKLQPYHDKQICQGKIYEFVKDWEPEDRERFLAKTKLCPNPNCNAQTERNGGCDKIPCKCGTYWCWRCRGVRSSNDKYAHYCPEDVNYTTERDRNDHGSVGDHGYTVKDALDALKGKTNGKPK